MIGDVLTAGPFHRVCGAKKIFRRADARLMASLPFAAPRLSRE
jgi:hypothetical protein